MRLAWLTDPHFNHCPLDAWETLMGEIQDGAPDALLISGDISEGEDVLFQLRMLADELDIPIHFVLGNHDFYHGSIDAKRAAVVAGCRRHPLLNYLTDTGPICLNDSVALVGEDGWGDATIGDFEGSPVRLNDFRYIDDFRLAPISSWRPMLIELGRQSAARLRGKLASAMATHASVLVVTHVPPFREACWYLGRTTDDWWAPFFVCGQVGEVLREAIEAHPEGRLEVLCGHTHNGGLARLGDRLTVTTAGAEYGRPEVAAWLTVDATGIRRQD